MSDKPRIIALEKILDTLYDDFFEANNYPLSEDELLRERHRILWNAITEYDVIRRVSVNFTISPILRYGGSNV